MNDDTGTENKPKTKSIPELIAELLQMAVTFVREQVRFVVEESAAGPLKQAGKAFAAGIIAAFLFGTALIFIAVSLFLLLLEFIPAWAAVGLIGIVLIVLGVIVGRRMGGS